MKKYLGIALSALIVAALIVAGIVLSDYSLSENQLETLNILIVVCAISAAYCFVVGEIARNFSQMDKLWSVLPVVYSWIIAARGDFKMRLVVYALIVTAWGIRLTMNFARKGAYSIKFWSGEEDYRWKVLRENSVFGNKAVWAAFDLLFISGYQNALVLAICFPALAAMESTAALNVFDIVAAVLALSFLTLETAADEYQWRFQQQKKKYLAEGKQLSDLPAPFDLGFNTTGPWGRMRHPNYLGEQGIWLSLYVFAIAAGVTAYGVFNWTMTGPLALVLLFMGSSSLAENISSGKYEKYADYVEKVNKYVPLRRYTR